MKINLKSWVKPIIIAVTIFFFARPAFAQIVENQVDLATFLQDADVEVGSEIDSNGFRQIYYIFNGEKKFITEGKITSASEKTEGEYIVYMSQIGSTWYIFLYNILSDTTMRLTHSGNSVNPSIEDGLIVWEGWVDDAWQVFLFDGNSVKQLTSGDLSINPDIEGNHIAYSRKDVTGTWRSVVYSLSEDSAKDIAVGNEAKKPKIKDGKIRFKGAGGEDKEFPLTIEDIFLLDLPALTQEEAVDITSETTEEDILLELDNPIPEETEVSGGLEVL